ncbi:MAG: S41 family peptidase [Burkholderiales bacterium]|jgi:carboxyl-terminal processing protease|nr:S41 family peptidase [Burkholderiales bacterium]
MGNFVKKGGLIALGALLGILISVHFSAVANQEQKATIPYEDLQLLAAVFGKIKSNYVDAVPDDKLIREAINGMVQGLDPHSAFLDGRDLDDLKVTTQGKFGGLGIEVSGESGAIRVVSPIEDTPAFRAGIKSGDLIVKIDETVTRGLPLAKAVDMMRGKPGTKVKLTIARESEPLPLEIIIRREYINIKSVRSKMVEPNYGYVRIRNFQENTGAEMVAALNNLYKEAPLSGLILDLRGDPGGLLDQAIAVSAAFLPQESLVVYTEGRTSDARMELKARRRDYQRTALSRDVLSDLPKAVKSVPMVVLIDSGSASASEIVAGALQDHKRATLMGAPSFGKGSVQTIMEIDKTHSLKLTTARYFTPSGRSIQAKGITPDIAVDDGRDVMRVREVNLGRHLETPEKNAENATSNEKESDMKEPSNPADNKEPRAKRVAPEPFEFGSKEDFQLQQALNELKGLPITPSNQPAKELVAATGGKDGAATQEATPKEAVTNKTSEKEPAPAK